jgi:hypothetical protein
VRRYCFHGKKIMPKNVLFTALSLLMLGISQFIFAADTQPAGTASGEPVPAEMVPAEPVSAATAPAEIAPVEMVPAKTAPAETPSSPGAPAQTQAPASHSGKQAMQAEVRARASQKDYRYCLDLKSNAEIAACAYKDR